MICHCVVREVIPSTVGEWIGWKDRNNRKGYEDDLYTNRPGRMWRIGWNDFYGEWDLFDKDDDSHWEQTDEEEFERGEITGTIHDQKEQPDE